MRSPFLVAVLVLSAIVPIVPPVAAASFTVNATNFAWTPATLSVNVGDSVTFANAGGTHTWVRDDAPDSCNLPCTRTFSTATTVQYHCGIHPSMTGIVQVGPGLTIAITSPAAGSTVGGQVAVSGTASHPSIAVSSVLVRWDNRTPIVATIQGSGNSVTWTATIDSTVLIDGPHDLRAAATTSNGLFAETLHRVSVDNPDRIDLRFSSVSAPASAANTVMTITFQLRNDGNANTATVSPVVRVRAEYLYQEEWRLIGEVNVAAVVAGGVRNGQMTWDPAGVLVGRFDIRVIADPLDALHDVDRSNNIRLGSAGWFTSDAEGVDLTDPL